MSNNKNFYVLNYKFRLYPTKSQESKLRETIWVCKNAYNLIVEHKNKIYSENKKYVSVFDSNKYLQELQKTEEHKYLNLVHSQVLQNVSNRVDVAYQRLFNKLSSFPRFKSFKKYKSFTFPQSGFKIKDKHLKLSKIGLVKIKLHREIVGKIKNCTIKRNSQNQWFAVFSVEQTPEQYFKSPQNTNNAVGIDIGLLNFLTLSDGIVISNSKFLSKSERKLKKLQRIASRRLQPSLDSKKPKSNRCKKALAKVSKLHNKIVNQRLDFQFKVANMLVNNYDLIAMEDLNVGFMLKNRHLSKSCQQTAIGQFMNILKFKSQQYQGLMSLVDSKNTSQQCSKCGAIVKKPLSTRIHKCTCGCKLDRDLNASINILTKVPKQLLINKNIYLKTDFVPKELGEFTPMEISPLDLIEKLNVFLLDLRQIGEVGSSFHFSE